MSSYRRFYALAEIPNAGVFVEEIDGLGYPSVAVFLTPREAKAKRRDGKK